MKSSCIIAFAVAATVSVALAEDNRAKSELAKFQGTWQLVSAISDGARADEEIVKKIRVVIKGNKHSVFFGDDPIAKDVPFKIDPSASPKTTDDMLPDARIIRGIYKLDGDTLTNCVGKPDQERPSEFASKAGSGHTLRVFQRVKP